MLAVKVLGPGCKNCEMLTKHAIQAAEMLQDENPDLEVTVEKVADVNTFLDYGLLKTPGLVINEKLISSGRIPSPSEIALWMEDAAISKL